MCIRFVAVITAFFAVSTAFTYCPLVTLTSLWVESILKSEIDV